MRDSQTYPPCLLLSFSLSYSPCVCVHSAGPICYFARLSCPSCFTETLGLHQQPLRQEIAFTLCFKEIPKFCLWSGNVAKHKFRCHILTNQKWQLELLIHQYSALEPSWALIFLYLSHFFTHFYTSKELCLKGKKVTRVASNDGPLMCQLNFACVRLSRLLLSDLRWLIVACFQATFLLGVNPPHETDLTAKPWISAWIPHNCVLHRAARLQLLSVAFQCKALFAN